MTRIFHRLLTTTCLAALTFLAACDKATLDQMTAFPSSTSAPQPVTEGSTASLYLTVVESLIAQGRNRAALGYLDQYAVSQSTTPRYFKLRGEALLGVGKYDEAGKAFAELSGTDLAAAGDNGLGRVDAAKNDWKSAEQHFAAAVTGQPSSADYLNNLGFAELHLGADALPKAEFNLRQAQELDPSSSSIRNNLVLALMMSGKEDDARAVLDGIPTPRERAEVQKFAADWVEARHKPATTE
ncbi:MAG: tetratricopeptide repeat protein [Parvibaculum sp.]|uniref:tetratricopeptide repeat protein n=1 Tax=Parvibaculum sp. TaxID=2024848 RepID=UPI00284AB4BF|nr:tetratricopeptide repeat protein [Parvibaculum sp.]MDR3498764.1 tetratricopeptide repeat protein [Parvibaculum sp.]